MRRDFVPRLFLFSKVSYCCCCRVFIWGQRPVISSGRFPFHVPYFDFNIWGIFVLFYYYRYNIIICFYLIISWIYWLEDNRILRLNSSKLPMKLLFSVAYQVKYLISFPFHFNEIEVSCFISTKLKWPFRFHSCLAKLKGNPMQNTQLVLVEQKTHNRILFITEYRPSVPNLKNILMSKWHLKENQPLLREFYKEPPLSSIKNPQV